MSHTVSLVAAAQFVIASGIAALIFSLSFLGLVYYISVDRMSEFDSWDYTGTRIASTLVATIAVLAIWQMLDIPVSLLILVVLLRISDAAVDLTWGFDLLRQSTASAMRRYATLNVAKLLLVLLPTCIIPLGISVSPIYLLVIGAAFAAVTCWIRAVRLSWPDRRPGTLRARLGQSAVLVRRTVWFTLGVAVSAAASNSPRYLIGSYYSGVDLGVAGVSLAFGTLFGMVFLSSWLRWFPKLSREGRSPARKFRGMIVDALGLALLMVLATVSVVPWIVATMFGFELAVGAALCRDILLGVVAFGFAMNLANLFKVTSLVWFESLCYFVGVCNGLCALFFVPSMAVPGFLFASAAGSLATFLFGMTLTARRERSDPREAQVAAFARFADRPVPRVTRMMDVARQAGLAVVFIGAKRGETLSSDTWEGYEVVRVGTPFPLLNGRKPFRYIGGILSCNVGMLKVLWHRSPGIVHASDIETFPAAMLYKLMCNCRLLYNIHDNLAQRYALPVPVTRFMNALEGLAVLLSDATLVPEGFRRDALPRWCQHKVTVVRNLPPDSGAAPPEPLLDGKIKIFYGGWLDWQRGLGALLELAKGPGVELRVAGEGSSEIVEAIRQAENVTFLGFLDSGAVLEETRRCHFVPVLYDPQRTINRYAASNKLAEALSLGRPIILNEELHISGELSDPSCVLKTPYVKAGAMVTTLRELASDPQRYAVACANARLLYDRNYSWASAKQASTIALFGTS
ncbi:hypothetical protein [Tardiphaga sp.]|uniref:hypothetical protein n=1 Tax=Tardiphaga sp. TaxID=1926292 RepID=UPI00260ED1BD|nr:hypothetical protein [Tardiphaga sp.]